VSNVLRQLEPQAAIDVAGDCERGLDLAGHGPEPDLVLLDLNLPGISGIPAVKLWRARYPGIAVVVLSATTDQQTVLAAMNAGAAGFIPKSSSNEVMLNTSPGAWRRRYLRQSCIAPAGPTTLAPIASRNDNVRETLGLSAAVEVLS
jgi:DNA-binding NarL/FixJ family response regulator